MELKNIMKEHNYLHLIKVNDLDYLKYLPYIVMTNKEIQEDIKGKTLTDNEKNFFNDLLKFKIDGLSGVIFDLEATCNEKSIDSNFDNETIEIGAVKIFNGMIVSDFSAFIKPRDTKITDFCTNLTTITDEDVKDADNFPKVLKDFKDYVDNLEVLSWGLYDKKQLIKDIKRHKLNHQYINWLESKHRSLKHEHGQSFKLNGGRGVGTERALKMCGETLEGTHHRGICDAYNISKIFIRNKDVFLK